MEVGSTDEDPITEEEMSQALGRRDKATLDGCLSELNIVKQKLDNCYGKLSRMTQLYGELLKQFNEFKVQRIKELNVKVNGGPTAR